MKILVTGAGGCIGAWVIRLLLEGGGAPIAYDLIDNKDRLRLLSDSPADADALPWLTGDIADRERLDAVVAAHKPDAIIHLAALQVPFCKADPVGGARANVVGTVNVFEAAKKYGVARLAYASSVAADAMQAPAERGWLQTLYGAFKVCNEQTARVYWQDARLASVGIRPSVVYGPARDQGMSAKPTLAMLAACAGVPYTIPFRGGVGFVYAAEAAAAFIRAVAEERQGAAVFNLNGTARTVEEVAEDIRNYCRAEGADGRDAAEIRVSGEALPFPSDMSDAPLREHIGAYRRHTFAEGLAETMTLFSRRLREGRLDAATLLERG